MGVASDSALVGREAEREQLDRLLASLEAGAAAALICGAAGIGKTAVWRAAVGRAEEAGVHVLRSRCAEVEMPIAFGALADLFEATRDEVAEGLSGPQRRALAVAFGRSDEEEPADWLVLAGAVLASMRTLAGRGPLLLAIDDLQWLDPGSRRVLAWALRRSGETPVGLLATLRDGRGERDPFALADTLPPGRFVTVDLGPLSAGALQHLIALRVGVHLPRPTLTRVQRASGGNPLFALEFARGLTTDRGGGRTAPLAVPASLEQLIGTRVAALPRRLRPLLELVAALERPTLPLLERFLEGGAAEALIEAAARAEALALNEDGVVRFTHPLLASAVYFAMTPPRRRALHRRLAELIDAVEERGRHAALGTATPDPAVATLLEEAAAAAAARGGLAAAAELADEAVRLTPTSDADARCRRVLTAAGWLVETGEFASARARLDSLLAGQLPAGSRSEALLLRAESELVDRGLLVALLREAQASAAEPRQRWRALLRLAHHGGWVSGDTDMAAGTARMALEVALELDETPLVDASAAALGFYQAARGRPDDVPVQVASGRGPGQLPRMQWWQVSPAVSLGCRLMWAGELDRARRLFEDEYQSHDAAGREAKAGFVRCWLSELEWRAGEWRAGETLAREATERLGDVNPTAFPRALFAASTGRAEEATAIAKGVLAWSATNDERVAPPRLHWLLGLLELSGGDAERAHVSLSTAHALIDAAGIREPGYLPLLPDLIESLVALNRLDEADDMVARLDARAAALGHRWALPAAQRSRAQLLLARRDAAAAAALAGAAANGFAAIGYPLDRGRALLVAGNAQRRLGQRRQATQPLTEATQIFARLGAPLWLRQAADELQRANPRPNRDRDRLTAAETRVATLVAAGRKNKEVAAELYTTVATVEAHLTRIYRKLGIRSRSELARHVAGEPVLPDQQ